MKHWLHKVGLYYLAMWRYRKKHVFRPLTFGRAEVVEFFTQEIACLLALTIVIFYPLSYLLLVIWRLSEPLRHARKAKIENIRKFLERPRPESGKTGGEGQS